jgi:hypothetical protein
VVSDKGARPTLSCRAGQDTWASMIHALYNMGILVPKETQGSQKAQPQAIKEGWTGLVSGCAR